MTDEGEIQEFVNVRGCKTRACCSKLTMVGIQEAKQADLDVERALGSKAQATDSEPPLGTNRIL